MIAYARRGISGGLAVVLLIACGAKSAPATGQILLFIDTDAPLASPSNPKLGPFDALPLFDSVRIDLFRPGETSPCDGCTNQFGVDSDVLASGASVGLVPPPGVAGYRARVRLYLDAFASSSGEPDPRSTVDLTVALPVVTSGVIDSETVVLLTEKVGNPVGSLDAPGPTTRRQTSSSLVGTWAPAKRVPCSGMPLADEVCIPGGAYWMGNPAVASVDTFDEGTTVRLVVLSPFFLQKTEVTVAAFRAAGATPAALWTKELPGAAGSAWSDWCTFAPTPRDCSLGFPCEDDPINCVSPDEALAYCRARGGDLPTEAQYEYAAGGLQSQLYVWGQDAPTCPDAVYARTSTSAETLTANIQDDCPAVGIGGPVPAGTGLLDQLIVPGGTVVDLAGDLAEWAADLWNQSSEACWSRPGIYTDPLCTTPSPADGRWYSTRGAGWLTEAVYLPAATRSYEAGDTAAVTSDAAPSVGFRCVRSARP